MKKLVVVINILNGDFSQGFPILVQIGAEGAVFPIETSEGDGAVIGVIQIDGKLPGASEIPSLFEQWREDFWQLVVMVSPRKGEQNSEPRIIKTKEKQRTNFSDIDCANNWKNLVNALTTWLNNSDNPEWSKILNRLRERLHPEDEIRVIITTKDTLLRRLPWQDWQLFSEIYPNSEIALSPLSFNPPNQSLLNKRHCKQVRILGIFGSITNPSSVLQINNQFDAQELARLRDCGAEVKIIGLDKPVTSSELREEIRAEMGWDILFFAGHSNSDPQGEIGWIQLSQSESLQMNDFKESVQTAVSKGLQLAIFNSCDGLGLANQLAELNIPQIIVMREPVPDQVAQSFVQNFLRAFTGGKSLYLSVREARSHLEDYEKRFPGVKRLPIIFQHPAVKPPTWKSLRRIDRIEPSNNRIILSLKGSKHEIYCAFGEQAIIGRSKSCEFWINDDDHKVSNLHAAIHYNLEKNEYWLEDLGSTNGTYVNEVKIIPYTSTPLCTGTKIKLGSAFTATFEHNLNDFLAVGVLIYDNSSGKEAGRYVIAPKDQILMGTNPNEVVRFPKLRPESSFGKIERKQNNFYLITPNHHSILLKDGMELSLDVHKIGVKLNIEQLETLSSTEDEASQIESGLVGSRQDASIWHEIPKPSGYELPPYITKCNTLLSIFVFLFGLVFNFLAFKPNPNQVFSSWVKQSLDAIQNQQSESWRIKTDFPPQDSVKAIFSSSLKNDPNIQDFLDKSGLASKIEQPIIYPKYHEFNNLLNQLKQEPNDLLLIITKNYFGGTLSLNIIYWTPNLQVKGLPTFEWSKTQFLYGHSMLILLITVGGCVLIRQIIIQRYQEKLGKEYEKSKMKRTQEIYNTQQRLNTVLGLTELARRLTEINKLLKSVSPMNPVYQEIIHARNNVYDKIDQQKSGVTTENPGCDQNAIKTVVTSSQVSKLLYLKILGTPYAYQVPENLQKITIGRQRPQLGETENTGSDVVIRVPGSDQKSLCISRRHLEIERITNDYFVFDQSGGRTKLNGKILEANQPYSLKTGDKLLIADVLTLEVFLAAKIMGHKVNNMTMINSINEDENNWIEIENPIGDMMTITEDLYE